MLALLFVFMWKTCLLCCV